jgi:hypothetical protein
MKSTFFSRIILVAIVGLLLFASCNKSSEFGADLLKDDAFNVTSLKDFKLTAYTRMADSVRTFEQISALSDSVMLFGNLEDPLFGNARSELAFNMRLKRVIEQWDPEFTFDSMVFSLAVDPVNFFGDTLKPLDINVHQLTAQLPTTDSVYFSNRIIPYEPEVIGLLYAYTFTPRTTIQKIDTTTDPPDTSFVRTLVNIRMDDFGRAIFSNPDNFASSTNFNQAFRGFYLKAEGLGPMVGLVLTSPSTICRIYYSKGETAQTPIDIEINPGSIRAARFFHETNGAVIEPFLADSTLGDSLLFIQGMSGARAIIELTELGKLENTSLKLAQLEFYIADLPGNNDKDISAPPQLLFSAINADGSIGEVNEVLTFATPNLISNLGGRVVEDIVDGMRVRKYTITMTAHILRMLSGLETNRIVLAPFGTSKRANRVVVYGPGHSRFPMQLKLIVTDYK